MKAIAFSLMLLLASAGASASVLGFDDLSGDETAAIANGYQGFDWSGIDTLVIYNSSGTQWAMDDFTVPEPASLGLFGTALAALAMSRKSDAAKKMALSLFAVEELRRGST